MEALAILLLIVINGLFAMSEISVVSARPARLRQWAKQRDEKAAALALRLPLSASPLRVLEMFKTSPVHMAHLIGTAGEIKGLVTLHDMLAAVVGALPTEREQAEPMVVPRPDGSWRLDGMLGVQELKEALGVGALPGEEADACRTLSGFVLARLGRVPAVGERFAWDGWQFEVVDMDGKRIDRVLVAPRRKAATRGARESWSDRECAARRAHSFAPRSSGGLRSRNDRHSMRS